MDDDSDYNILETNFALDQTGDGLGADEPSTSVVNVVNSLNNIERRNQKRRLTDECDIIDWHMRIPLDKSEKENGGELDELIMRRLTERIVQARKKRRLMEMKEDEESQLSSSNKNKEFVMSYPPTDGTPWIGFTAPDNDQRLYIKLKTDSSYQNDQRMVSKSGTTLFSSGLTEKLINSGFNSFSPSSLVDEPLESDESMQIPQGDLWVDKYSPKSYADLISDESVNRMLLQWFKLWDECVFHKSVASLMRPSEIHFDKLSLSDEKPQRPSFKVVLLAGPAGVGKTTLATVVARHVGYQVVNLNASDERNKADFERYFESALRTTRTLDAVSRPSCLLLDEIDGAPAESIHFLCKTVSVTGKRSIRRPIICICNNLYTPSLRELRSAAFVLQVKLPDVKRLIKRLEQISDLEHVKVDISALNQLVSICSEDLRLSINSLQFMAAKFSGKINRKAVIDYCSSQQHCGERSLFEAWATVFDLNKHLDANGRIQNVVSRIRLVSSVCEQFLGESDRFHMGIFNNYLTSKLVGRFTQIRLAGDQFIFYDLVSSCINATQNYSLLKYIFIVDVGIHLLLSTRERFHLTYPSAHQVAMQQCRQSKEIIQSFRSGGALKVHSGSTLVFDILPLLVIILQPELKPMNSQLYSVRELNVLRWIVKIMRSYSLNYISISKNGRVHYVFQPAIESVTMFTEDENASTDKTTSNILTDAARQMIAHEIEIDKLRSADENEESVETSETTGGAGVKTHSKQIFYQYNQGSSNAIRKNIKMSSLLFG